MEEFKKNIDGIRRMMSDLRDEKYAIVNQDLVSLDEYTKTLYLRILCTVMQLGEEPTETQVLFLKRIVAGIGVDDPAEEYMRRALDISAADMQEFLTGMKENIGKYYFALDALILVSIGMENQECYQYLAEIIELLDICKDDLEYVCLVARSVLQQQSLFYDQAKELTSERVREVDYSPYIQSFYAGAIRDSVELVHYSAPDKKYSDSVKFRSKSFYSEKRVIFENLSMDIKRKWVFNNCEEVIFKNCNFTGNEYSIELHGCRKAIIYKCRFDNFRASVFQQEECKEIVIEECEFENCIGECSEWRSDGGGGVIYDIDYRHSLGYSLENRTRNIIRKTRFRNCGGRLNRGEKMIGAISNSLCEVNDCSFYNCHHYGDDGIIDRYYSTLFREGTVGSNNELFNSIKFS